MPRPAHCENTGFSLIELMVVLAVVAIALTVAAPSFREIIQNNRLSAQLNDLLTALSLARSEAIKRGVAVTVCKSADGASCGANWGSGWITFTDEDGDGTPDLGSGTCGAGEDCILRRRSVLESGNTLTGTGGVTARVTFRADGLSPGYRGTLTLCDSRGAAHARAAVVSNAGRVAPSGTTVDGAPLTCP